jgi:hypothetical protein
MHSPQAPFTRNGVEVLLKISFEPTFPKCFSMEGLYEQTTIVWLTPAGESHSIQECWSSLEKISSWATLQNLEKSKMHSPVGGSCAKTHEPQ